MLHWSVWGPPELPPLGAPMQVAKSASLHPHKNFCCITSSYIHIYLQPGWDALRLGREGVLVSRGPQGFPSVPLAQSNPGLAH